MKNIILLCTLLLSVVFYAQKPFIGVWATDAKKKITLPAKGSFSYTYQKVGSPSIKGAGKGSGTTTISLTAKGNYLISITPNSKFAFDYGDYFLADAIRSQFKELKQWGSIQWNNDLSGVFAYCYNLKNHGY